MRRLGKTIGFDHRRCPHNTRAGALLGSLIGVLASLIALAAGELAGIAAAVLLFTAAAAADWRFHASR